MIVFEATVYDHSGLGGPMGTERISKIEGTLWLTREDAVNHIRAWVNKYVPHCSKDIPQRWSGTSLDLGGVGVAVHHKTVHALKRPSRRVG